MIHRQTWQDQTTPGIHSSKQLPSCTARTSLAGSGLHDGMQHGMPLLVRRLLRLLLLLLLLRRHLLPALRRHPRHSQAAPRSATGVDMCRWRRPYTTAAQPDLCAAAVLAHQLLHAALPDCLQLRVIRLWIHPIPLDSDRFSR